MTEKRVFVCDDCKSEMRDYPAFELRNNCMEETVHYCNHCGTKRFSEDYEYKLMLDNSVPTAHIEYEIMQLKDAIEDCPVYARTKLEELLTWNKKRKLLPPSPPPTQQNPSTGTL